MNKRITIILICLTCLATANAQRKQWTEKQAWEWQERVGVIKGFNEPYPAYPGQTRDDIFKKAVEVGLNSVRFWVQGSNVEERVKYIRGMIDDASRYGLTVSPVLAFPKASFPAISAALKKGGGKEVDDFEKQVRGTVRPFADDLRIVFWDLCNEPRFEDQPITYESMDVIEQMVKWCWQENLRQPITSSIIWATINTDNQALKRTTQVEAMMDIHNFHSYDCALNFGKNIYDMLDYIKSIGDRPMVATECLTRVNGSGVARSFAAFSKYKVGFYIWGLFINDRNWEARWDRSTYDPYDPMFHNILYSDGDMYDAREVELIRNYHFAKEGENPDPGIEITDRWSHERAWRWMVTGPLTGVNCDGDLPGEGEANAVRLKLDYKEWKADKQAFLVKTYVRINEAAKRGMTVVPVLLDDNDATEPAESLGAYVADVIKNHYCDTLVKAWDLYDAPGKTCTDKQKLDKLVTTVFRYARNEFPNQPLTMTPVVRVKPFEEGFDPWKALMHGRTDGWNRLDYSGGSSPDLVYKIWSLSDVTSFATDMPAAETRWLASICYRFGRPIFCMSWLTGNTDDMVKMEKAFADFHVFWFADKPLPDLAKRFRFNQTSTQRQITEGM